MKSGVIFKIDIAMQAFSSMQWYYGMNSIASHFSAIIYYFTQK